VGPALDLASCGDTHKLCACVVFGKRSAIGVTHRAAEAARKFVQYSVGIAAVRDDCLNTFCDDATKLAVVFLTTEQPTSLNTR
jgi:hypothetical protein